MTDTIIRDQTFWDAYLQERTGTYEFRCRRYAEVLYKLRLMGFADRDSLCDVGAGRQEFATFLHQQGWNGDYLPIDGSIDGTDLDTWMPTDEHDWMVAIEVIEHVYDPARLIAAMHSGARGGIVVTTPNPEVVDVLAIDRTHVSVIHPYMLAGWGMTWNRATLFGSPTYRKTNDSLIAWKEVNP